MLVKVLNNIFEIKRRSMVEYLFLKTVMYKYKRDFKNTIIKVTINSKNIKWSINYIDLPIHLNINGVTHYYYFLYLAPKYVNYGA